MNLFSQRKGLKPLEKTLQRDSLDDETRNRLWTVACALILDKWTYRFEFNHDASAVENLLSAMWFRYFKEPSDTRPPMHWGEYKRGKSHYDILREHFLTAEWNEVFDLIEFSLAELPERFTDPFCASANIVLTDENSAYRLVDNLFVEITNESEIEEVDAASAIGLDGVALHVSAAVKYLSDRKKPDYRNSIKESISAVESLFKLLTGNKSATLGEGLKEMKAKIDIHPALLSGFEKIYAYTSDQGGIRHAIFDSDKTSFSDAKFMLVSCSAFINYAIGKFAESGKKFR
jgi:hypothetical protein